VLHNEILAECSSVTTSSYFVECVGDR